MEKMTFRQKIENFWYHNKFAVLVGTAFFIFIAVSTIQLLTKKSPDANFLYMGPAAVAFAGEQQIQESMAEIMKDDYNKDGEKHVDYIELTSLDVSGGFDDTEGDFATGFTSSQVYQSVGQDFAAHIIAGDSMIYLLDETYFNVARDTGVLMPLSEALGYTPEFALNEYAVYLKDLDVSYLPGLKLLPKSTLLCIRYPVTLTSGKSKVEKREKCNLSVFRDMFSYVYEDKPEEIVLPDPVSISLEEFTPMYKEYAEKKELNVDAELLDITPEGFFEAVGGNLFRADNTTYLVHYDKLIALGKHIGGEGILDIIVTDMDEDSKSEIVYTYSYAKNDSLVYSTSVFNMATMKETFLSVENLVPLTLEKAGTEVKIYGDDNGSSIHLYTLKVNDGKYNVVYN